jgi:elongator complex protein 2
LAPPPPLAAGALHLWRNDSGACTPVHALGGHFGPVQDLCWGVDGRCLLSVSADQTARLFTDFDGHWCELARPQVGAAPSGGGLLRLLRLYTSPPLTTRTQRPPLPLPFFSLCTANTPNAHTPPHPFTTARQHTPPPPKTSCRPQIHGHDFSCVAAIPTAPGASPLYVSGSEEKVLRVFEAPLAFQDTLDAARGGAAGAAGGDGRQAALVERHGRALGAAVGALGLSNKALYEGEERGGEGGGTGRPSPRPPHLSPPAACRLLASRFCGRTRRAPAASPPPPAFTRRRRLR